MTDPSTASPAISASPSSLPSSRSRIGLNAVNFFLAEMAGVILPFLSDFLKQKNWEYSQIGITIAASGLGTLLFQLPAGILSDQIRSRRLMLGLSSIILGICYGILPFMVKNVFVVNALLFISGMGVAFFVPLLAALALSLVGHKNFDRTMGINQGWNHAGNIAASVSTIVLVKLLGIVSIFYIMGVISAFAAASLLLIKGKELNPDLSQDRGGQGVEKKAKPRHTNYQKLFRSIAKQFYNTRVVVLFISVICFHIANAPTMATVALYLKELGASDDYVAWAIIIGQTVMVPVSVVAAKYCTSLGRKPVMVVAFLALSVRICLYPLTKDPHVILAIQLINGIDAGIYGVVICLICGDLTRGKEGFNTLLSIMTIAIALGGVLGPVAQGFITQHFGFPMTFMTFAIISIAGAVLFILKMPETKLTKK